MPTPAGSVVGRSAPPTAVNLFLPASLGAHCCRRVHSPPRRATSQLRATTKLAALIIGLENRNTPTTETRTNESIDIGRSHFGTIQETFPEGCHCLLGPTTGRSAHRANPGVPFIPGCFEIHPPGTILRQHHPCRHPRATVIDLEGGGTSHAERPIGAAIVRSPETASTRARATARRSAVRAGLVASGDPGWVHSDGYQLWGICLWIMSAAISAGQTTSRYSSRGSKSTPS